MPASIRSGLDRDADAFIALIWACWSQYPGVHMDVDREMPELRALESYYAGQGGAVWAAEADGQLTGMVATRPDGSGGWEICRVYVHPSRHGSGLGHRLLDRAESHARAAGATRLVLWSDTRFERAHRFYEKRSYVRSGPIRVLHDISHSLEFAYAKPVDGIEVLDAAGAASAERRLGDILAACVDAGASVGFLPPLAPPVARGVWKGVARQVAAGGCILLAGWAAGELIGTVMLDLGTPADQPHRGAVRRLLVHPDVRRQGMGRALMRRLEAEAARAGRSLLTLDARADGAASCLCRDLGWQEAGRIPGCLRGADGVEHAMAFFWKRAGEPSGPIPTLGSQALGESAHQIKD